MMSTNDTVSLLTPAAGTLPLPCMSDADQTAYRRLQAEYALAVTSSLFLHCALYQEAGLQMLDEHTFLRWMVGLDAEEAPHAQ